MDDVQLGAGFGSQVGRRPRGELRLLRAIGGQECLRAQQIACRHKMSLSFGDGR
jgi:hypothetical protein